MSFSSLTTVLLSSLIIGSLVISSNYFPTVFAQTPEELIDDIQETMGEVEDIGDVLDGVEPEIQEIIESIRDNFSYMENLGEVTDEVTIVDYTTYSISELRKTAMVYLEDNSLKHELFVILDNAEDQLNDAGNFVLTGNELGANNSISKVQDELTEFLPILESESGKKLSENNAEELMNLTKKIIEDSKKRDIQTLTIVSYASSQDVFSALHEETGKIIEKNRELFSKLESTGVELSAEVGLPQGNTLSYFDPDFQRTDVLPSPKRQVDPGTEEKDVTCKESLQLIFKSTDGSPACVTPKTVEKLIERGWANS